MTGSRDATREAFQRKLIQDGNTWMEMIQSRNQTTHTYNQITADAIVNKILNEYFLAFQQLTATMHKLDTDGKQ